MSDESGYKFDIFLRYHRAQARWTRQLAERLDREGFRVWLDVWMLPPGSDRRVELQQAIEECRWLAVVFSPEFVANPWPKDELYTGFPHAPARQNQRLLPLLYAPCDLPRPVQAAEAIDFTGSDEDLVLFEFQTQQLMARLDPSFRAPGDLQRFRLLYQRAQPIEEEEVGGWQSFLRSLQTAILRIAGGQTEHTPEEGAKQIAILQFLQRLFQWNTADLQFDKAEELFRRGSNLEALAAYDRALNVDPNFALAWGRRGDVLVRLGRYREAVDSFNGSLSINPYDEATRLHLALIQGRMGQYKAAVINYDKVLEINPENALAWQNRGVRLLQIGRPKLAANSLVKALRLDANATKAWLARGYALHKLGRFGSASQCFARALRRDKRNATAWRWQGNALLKANRSQAAFEAYNRALRLKGRDPVAWHNRGVALLQLNRYQAAVKSFDRVFDLDPDNAKTWHARGLAFEKLGYWKQALTQYEEALRIQPKYFPAQYARAIALQRLSNHQAALAQFDLLLQSRPRSFACWYGKITCLRRLGRWPEALEASQGMIALKPEDPLGHFAWAMAQSDSGAAAAAIEGFTKVLELKAGDATALNNRAWNLCELGRYAEALPDAEAALQKNPQNPIYWHTLGRCQEGSDRVAAAISSYQKALQLNPKFGAAQRALQALQSDPLPDLSQLTPNSQPVS